MQRRGKQTVYDRMMARTPALALVLTLSLLSFSCAGGSGSSGFDLAENTAIEMALDEQRCVASDGLTICPAGMVTQPAPNATGTPLPFTPTPTPTGEVIDVPTETPATPSAQGTATAAPSSTATPTETPTPIPTPTAGVGMAVDTSFDGAEGPACIPTDTPGVCILPFTFAPQGFSSDTHYQVAARGSADDPWELFDALLVSFDAPTPVFGANIPVDAVVQSPTGGVVLQTAVLVYIDQPPFLRAMELIERLAESGADFAFVNPEEEIRTED